MHELSLMENVFNIVLEHGQIVDAKRIIKVNLEVGALSDVIQRWAQLYFDMISQDTIADKAKLSFTTIPAIVKCHACGNEYGVDIDKVQYSCPKCESKYIELISGREFRIVSIEVE